MLLLEDDIKLKKSFMPCLNDLIEMTSNKYIINMSQPNGVLSFKKKTLKKVFLFWVNEVGE